MGKISRLSLFFLIFIIGCGKTSVKKPDRQDIKTKGAELFAKYGCAVCHSLEGKEIYGPPLNEIYMKKIKVLREGKEYEIVADRNYLKKAISEPRYEKVMEYKNKEMPMSTFTDEETEILVDYLISLNAKNKRNE